jgi:hypothetical protein
MQPLDRNNACIRSEAATMRTATVRQRLDAEEQRNRIEAIGKLNQALRERLSRRDDGS